MLTYKVPLSLTIEPGQMYCALSLDIPDHLGHRVFWGDRDQHVHVIGHQMTLFYSALFLRC